MRINEEIEALKQEALRVHAEFRKVRKALRDNPGDLELQEKKRQVRKLYKKLERQIRNAIDQRDGASSEKSPDDIEDRETASEQGKSPEPSEGSKDLAPDEDEAIVRSQRNIKQKAHPQAQFRKVESLAESRKTSSLRILTEKDIASETVEKETISRPALPSYEAQDPESFDVRAAKFRRPVLVGPSGSLEIAYLGFKSSLVHHPIRWLLGICMVIGGTILLLQYSVIGLYRVTSDSMQPALHDGDVVLFMRAVKWQRGDIVLVEHPMRPETLIPRRLVARGEDKVEIRRTRLRVNDVPIHESYILSTMSYTFAPMKMGPQEVFVLADDRNDGDDCHTWESGVSAAGIHGVPKFVIWPFSRWSRVESRSGDFAHLDAAPLYVWQPNQDNR